MSTLLLSPFFHPESISTGRYNTVLADALVAQGEAVTVIASHPLYPSWRPVPSAEQLPGITTLRAGAWMRYPRSAVFRRLLLECWFALHVCGTYLSLRAKPDHVVPVFPPSLFMPCLAPLLARGSRVTGIVHDLQGVHASSSPSLLGRTLQGAVRWIEKQGFMRCDRLIFLSRSMADRAIQQYALDPAICVVCYPFLTLPPRTPHAGTALASVLPDGLVHVVYSGALGDKQSPDALIGLLAEIRRRHPRVRCHVFSAGSHFDRLKAAHGSIGVEFHALVASEHLDELYARSSIQLIPQAAGTADGSLPSKLPNLIAAGVPIFAICDDNSEVGRILEDAQGGSHVAAFAGEETLSRFDALLHSIETEPRAERTRRQYRFVAERFSVQKVVDAILT